LRILGIAGSPRRGGNTDLLLAKAIRGAESSGAKVKTIVLCQLDIAPCDHSDDCLVAGDCSIQDDMQMVYRELERADRIVLASPIHFMGVTAQTKAMIDRCQALWARKYKLKVPPLGDERERQGLFISVGGRSKTNQFRPAQTIVKSLFTSLNVTYVGELLFPGVDKKGVITKHPDALKQAFLAGQRLVEEF
jgi:multimeric flavodoxin WrbA